MVHKKNFLWGKHYFGHFVGGDLEDTILYSEYFGKPKVLELENLSKYDPELLQEFITHFIEKKSVRYFLRELNEIEQVDEIGFMHEQGFKRFSRNYCFEFNKDLAEYHREPTLICMDAGLDHTRQIRDLDIASQILEYRDEIYKSKSYLLQNLDDIFVFVNPRERSKVLAFAVKRPWQNENLYRFIIHPSNTDMVEHCIQAFAEKYIHIEKNLNYRFVINECHKKLVDKLKDTYQFLSSTQLLIKEGAPKSKSKSASTLFAVRKAATS